MAHIDKNWEMDEDYHLTYTLISNVLLIFINLFFIFFVNRRIVPTIAVKRRASKYVFGILGALIITVVYSSLSGLLQHQIYDNHPFSATSGVTITRDLVVSVTAVVIAVLILNFSRRVGLRMEKEHLQTENLLVRYEALEKQIDPHFLFNSLNTLSGLIGTDDERAQQYLQQLAATYRYIMQGKRLVKLQEELDFVESYCEMMKIRYGDNLTFINEVDNSYLQRDIVPISIQILIENALKHNIVSERYPLEVHIETTPHETLRVSNIMRPKQEDTSSSGMGLANLDKRYELLCNKHITISDSNGVFSVEVPLLSSQTLLECKQDPISRIGKQISNTINKLK